MTDPEPQRPAETPSTWEQSALEKLLQAGIIEQRRSRRWSVGLKVCFLVYLIVVTWIAASPLGFKRHSDSKGHTAVIDVVGPIVETAPVNADVIIDGLRDALKDKGTRGVILRLNSPGGSPVQSAYVWEEIRRQRKEHPDIPIYGVVGDLCASGCYYIGSAVDKIFVNPSSVVGSIGVIMNGFGFVDTMARLGVERRLLTAGSHKALLDPFSPVDDTEKTHIQGVLNGVHEQFIDAVKKGRGARLKEDPTMFTGLVWLGQRAIDLGLVDEIGDIRSVAKNVIRAEELVNFTPQERLLDRLSHRIGTSIGLVLESALGLASPQLR